MVDRKIVEEIVKEVLDRQRHSERPVLYVIQQKEPSRELIRKLEESWTVKWINPEHSEFPEDMDSALFPQMDQDLLVKSALGITDTVFSKWFAKILRKGADVHVMFEKELASFLQETGPYASYLNEYASRLEIFSVLIADNVASVVPNDSHEGSPAFYSGELITEKVVEEWRFSEIHVSSDTIITPLARDVAKERSITFLHR